MPLTAVRWCRLVLLHRALLWDDHAEALRPRRQKAALLGIYCLKGKSRNLCVRTRRPSAHLPGRLDDCCCLVRRHGLLAPPPPPPALRVRRLARPPLRLHLRKQPARMGTCGTVQGVRVSRKRWCATHGEEVS